MITKILASDLTATWIIEQEMTGTPGLLGTAVRIEIQKVNPMLSRPVITPVSGSDSKDGVFGRIKPAIVLIQDDMLLCSMGILARRKK
jgi:hypothetical protein